MIPEKLEILKDNPTWITLSNVIGFGFNIESRPELAAEIVKRYNAYPDLWDYFCITKEAFLTALAAAKEKNGT